MRSYGCSNKYFLLFRWLLVSWTLQGVHVRDYGEKKFRIFAEASILTLFSLIGIIFSLSSVYYALLLVGTHTFFWFIDSTLLVGFREVCLKYPGRDLTVVLKFLVRINRKLESSEDVDAVLVYGSLCRGQYHKRSDLDLRILKRGTGLRLYFYAMKLRASSLFVYGIPLDLKIVDSMSFLVNEMSEAEKPIVILNQSTISDISMNNTIWDVVSNIESYKK